MDVSLKLPIPPSVNKYWVRTKKGGLRLSDDAVAFKQDVSVITRNEGLFDPVSYPVCVELVFCPPDRRRRDLDNIMKAVFDSLKGSVYEDDSQVVKIIAQKIEPSKRNARVEITVTPAIPF